MRKSFLWGLLILQFLMADAASALLSRARFFVAEAGDICSQRRPYAKRQVLSPLPAPGSPCANHCYKVCEGFSSCPYPYPVARPGVSLAEIEMSYALYAAASRHFSPALEARDPLNAPSSVDNSLDFPVHE